MKDESMEDAIQAIWTCQQACDRREHETIGQVVDDLSEIASHPKVETRHDDWKGLPQRLSAEFLSAHPSEADEPGYEDECLDLLKEIEVVTSLYLEELSEDDEDDINDERTYVGDGPDDDPVD